MSILAFAFFVELGALLHRSRGLYDPAIVWLAAAFGLVVIDLMRSGPWLQAGRRMTERLLAGAALFFCALQFSDPVVVYATPGAASTAIPRLMGLAGALSAGTLMVTLFPSRSKSATRAAAVMASAAIAVIAAAELLVPRASPTPWIDVWVSGTRAVDYLTAGLNPYAQKYVDIYQGRYPYVPGFLYPPGLLLWLTPFRLAFGDIRFALIVANWISAAAFFASARTSGRRDLLPILSALVWLSFPVTNFVIEQAWSDLALVPTALLMLLATSRARMWASSTWMGVFVVMKQYAFVAAALTLVRIWKSWGARRALETLAVAATLAALVILPFAVADLHALARMTIAPQTDQTVRLDALNVTSYLAHAFGWVMPPAGRIGLTLLGGALAVVAAWRERAPVAAASFIAYGFAFLFGKWAFCNYYFFLASFLLTCLVAPADV